MKDLVKSADITEALRTIKVLNEKLSQQQIDVNTWKISFDVDVNQDDSTGEFEVVITGRVGNSGLRKVISEKEISYYTTDKETIAKELANLFLNSLLKDATEKALTPSLVSALTNVERLIAKRGLR